AGYTRATGDIDFLVNAEDGGKFKDILQAMGYKVIFEDENVLNLAAPWQLIGGVDAIWARRKYTLDMLKHAVTGVDGIPVVAPEGIIGLKVQAIANDPERYARDIADIEWLLRAHTATLDMALIREYFLAFTMTPELDKLLQRIGHAH
ncbi:MAG: nucleotidyl transferase AbiEii/AbiGii toxin family protein, partial [Candidatus Omnitrophica bacterium]|nr:nucleotidyl transferase AbiEii/AbiGii toxin family protein [Candidatus Omnitrophota bacterium]